MLSASPLIAFVPTLDANRARAFYQHTLGLTLISQDSFAVVMDAHGTMLRITTVPEFIPYPFTVLGWGVEDIDSAVAGLAAKGVEFLRYSFLQQASNGVWTTPDGSAKVAWFLDPDGNTLSLSQHSPSAA